LRPHEKAAPAGRFFIGLLGCAQKEEAQAVLDCDFRGIVNEIGGGAALGNGRAGEQMRGENAGLAIGVHDVGTLKHLAEFVVLRGQSDGVAVEGKDKPGMGSFDFARGKTVDQHHAAKLGARQAGRFDAAQHHFFIGIIGMLLGYAMRFESGWNAKKRAHQTAFLLPNTTRGVRRRIRRYSQRLSRSTY